MCAASDFGGIALVITAMGTFVISIATAYNVLKVHKEVKTGNGQTIGMLADIAEGRAAQAIPTKDRTDAEQKHANIKVAIEDAAGHVKTETDT